MQLARNLYIDDPERDLERKIKEAKIAEELEEEHSKDWIIENYLNTASYGTVNGRTAVGVEAAAQIYYSKKADKLDLAESAMLAGLPQSPSLYNPLQNPRSALQRRNEVLEEMEKQDYISESEYEDAIDQRIGLNPGNRYEEIREPYFFDFVEQQLIEEYGVNTVRGGGLKVQTTIDPQLRRPDARRSRTTSTTRPTPPRRSSRSTPTTATSRRWPPAAATRTRSSTSRRKDIGSPARPPRPGR